MKTENMTFGEALKAMEQGHKVRRKEWYNNAETKDDYLCIIGNTLKNIDGQPFSYLKSEIILATDWEICTESKPWSQFEIGELVMMRDSVRDIWLPKFFSRYHEDKGYYTAISSIPPYKYCAKFDKDIVFTNKPEKQ